MYWIPVADGRPVHCVFSIDHTALYQRGRGRSCRARSRPVVTSVLAPSGSGCSRMATAARHASFPRVTAKEVAVDVRISRKPLTGRNTYRFAEHGGEVEVELESTTEMGLFAAATDAFAELVSTEAEGPCVQHEIEVEGDDRAVLLVDWLNELVYLARSRSVRARAGWRPSSSVATGLAPRLSVTAGKPVAPRESGSRCTTWSSESGGGMRWHRQCRARQSSSLSSSRRQMLLETRDPVRAPMPGETCGGCTVDFDPRKERRVDVSVLYLPARAESASTRCCGRSLPRARPDMRIPARIFADARAARRDRQATASSSSSPTWPRCPASSRRRWRCPTSTRATAFRSAAWRRPTLPDGVISPGGVGYDINCGVRLLAPAADGDELGRAAGARSCTRSRGRPGGPAGGGRSRPARRASSTACCATGRARCVEARHRSRGGARVHRVGRAASRAPTRRRCPRAPTTRGAGQLGTLGGGNHFLELQRVEEVYDPARRPGVRAARRPADRADPLRVARARPPGLHRLRRAAWTRGSRATGSSCPTASSRARRLVARGTRLPRRRWRPPRTSRWPTAHAIAHRVREAFAPRCSAADAAARRIRSTTSPTTSPSSSATRVATVRAPQGRDARVPARHRRDPGASIAQSGQPVFIPGSMGTASYVLAGRPARWSARSATPATAPAARCPAPRRASAIGGAELRRAARGAGHRRALPLEHAGWPRRRPTPTRTSTGWSRSSSAPGWPRRVARLGRSASSRARRRPMATITKEEKITLDGEVVEALPNATFQVIVDGGHPVLGYLSGRMRRGGIRVLPGDRLTIELFPYASRGAGSSTGTADDAGSPSASPRPGVIRATAPLPAAPTRVLADSPRSAASRSRRPPEQTTRTTRLPRRTAHVRARTRPRRLAADQLEADDGRDGDGGDHARGSARPGPAHGGDHGRPGRQAVVDEQRGLAREVEPGMLGMESPGRGAPLSPSSPRQP